MLIKIRKFRGLGIKYYMFVVAVGIGSSFYIFKPVIDRIERKSTRLEQESAISAIEAAKKIQ